MTSIHGVDPIVVNNIKVKTQKPPIIETQKAKVSEDKKGKDQDKEKHHREPSQQNLMTAVEKLNSLLELNKIPLFFQIINNQGVTKVQLIDVDNKNIISEMLPEKVFRLAKEYKTKGFSIDELI